MGAENFACPFGLSLSDKQIADRLGTLGSFNEDGCALLYFIEDNL